MSIALTETVAPQAAQFEREAQQVAAAERNGEKTTATMQAAQAKLAQIDGRVVALQDQRSSIIARRTSGQHEADDGARLALINGDLEGLAGLRTTAEAAVAAARQTAEAATQQLAAAQQTLRQTEDHHAHRLLVAHAETLDRLLTATVITLTEVEHRLGRSGSWGASRELRDIIRRMAAARGEL